MEILTREQLKKLFKKVKKLRLPDNLEEVDFAPLNYYSWMDETDSVLYMVYNYKGVLTGIPWKANRLSLSNSATGGLCDICQKHRKLNQIVLGSAKTKNRPKGVDYRTRGKYMCIDYAECNNGMKNCDELDYLFSMIFDQE